jgi:hypothetical protein
MRLLGAAGGNLHQPAFGNGGRTLSLNGSAKTIEYADTLLAVLGSKHNSTFSASDDLQSAIRVRSALQRVRAVGRMFVAGRGGSSPVR